MILKHNHRQGEGSEWVNTLNRIRVGICNEEDEKVLKSMETTQPWLDERAMHLFYKNKDVFQHNHKMLNKLKSELEIIEAIQYLPKGRKAIIDPSKGTIAQTEFQQTLKIKIGARVVIVFNVNIIDGIVNGECGKVVGIEKQNGKIFCILVQFDSKSVGENQRQKGYAKYPYFKKKYMHLNGTPIFKESHEFNLGSKNGQYFAANARLKQFPLRLGWAQTGHKMQVSFQFHLVCMYFF